MESVNGNGNISLSRDTQVRLLEIYRVTLNPQVETALVNYYLPLISSELKKRKIPPQKYTELLDCGVEGIVVGLSIYDAAKEIEIEDCVRFGIQASIEKGIERKQTYKPNRVPENPLNDLDIQGALEGPVSLDATLNDDSDTTYANLIPVEPDQNNNPRLRKYFLDLIDTYITNTVQKQVVKDRFAFNERETVVPLEEFAERYRLARENLKSRKSRGLNIIRKHIDQKRINDLLYDSDF